MVRMCQAWVTYKRYTRVENPIMEGTAELWSKNWAAYGNGASVLPGTYDWLASPQNSLPTSPCDTVFYIATALRN
eukprot:490907-Pelagomonas_calceolata.AAC.1